ncbi:hypothetical protein RD792_003755 [Penstemon davidsonii]|uniref:Disease resistance protein At4g27190-like leucine-rich repeats domain-containing protein n=1 Tax=Penstemon davidsonii TaxID=160366 RepID=A0ABR0DGG1_9LAMI|nr:hypothetical protein RD792_003755 [Penstemon davidsonii]
MPEGMKMLVNLQYLDVSFTEVFNDPYCLLPHYRFLQCLFLTGTRQFSFGKLFADFLAKYRNLVVLQVNFGNMQDFDHYIASGQWNLLENFSFFIGYPPSFMHTKQNYVGLFWVNICERLSPPWLPGRIFELEICDCSSIKYLPLFITAASSQLQRCKIKSCDKMECIVTPEWSTFPNLEWLEIEGLINLSRLCRGILKANTFASLKTLNVRSCNNLKTLLPLELVQYLTNLAEIKIEECYQLKEVISEDGEITEVNHSHIVLPSLQKLILSSLPRLKHISRGVMICDSLSSLEVFMCPDLKTLPFLVESREELVDSVKQIKGSRKWWKTIKKNHINTADLLDHVFKNVPEQSANEEDSEDDSISSDVPEPLQLVQDI